MKETGVACAPEAIGLFPDALEGEVEAGDQGRIARAYENLIGACNACHKAVNRPYIHIERQVDNPYPQNFSPTP